METAEIFLPVFWVAFAPLVVIVLAIGAEWIGDHTGQRAVHDPKRLRPAIRMPKKNPSRFPD